MRDYCLRWLDELHRTGKWKPLANAMLARPWQVAPSMQEFVVKLRKCRGRPTDKQLRLLIALTAQTQALLIWDRLKTDERYEQAAMSDTEASSEAGAEMLTAVLANRSRKMNGERR